MVPMINACPSCKYIFVASFRFSGRRRFECSNCSHKWSINTYEMDSPYFQWIQKLYEVVKQYGKEHFINWLIHEYDKPIKNL